MCRYFCSQYTMTVPFQQYNIDRSAENDLHDDTRMTASSIVENCKFSTP